MRFRAIEKNKGRFLTIMYDVNFGKGRLRGKTNLQVPRDCIKTFNSLSLKTTNEFTQAKKLETLGKLNDFELHIETTKADLKSENLNNPLPPLKEAIEIYFGRTKEQESEKTLSLFEFMDYYTEIKKNETTTKNGAVKKITNSTINEYKRLKTLLGEYRDEKKIALNYKTINNKFYNEFSEWLEDYPSKPNTIGKHIKNLKLFMNKAHIEGHHNNLKFKSFKILKEKVDHEYLNESEIEELFNKRSSFPKKYLPKIDYFLLMCYTSLRVSDMLTLRKKNIIMDEIPLLEWRESKNSAPVYIRITNKVQTILDFYDGCFPNDLIDTKVNRGQSINDVLIRIFKHKKIRNHCGRRSFVNNEIIKGTPYDDIIRTTNHKSRESFNHYVVQSTCKELLKARARREFDK